MNTAFTKLSRVKTYEGKNQTHSGNSNEFSKVQVNVVGNWSGKRGPTVSFSVQPSPTKKQRLESTEPHSTIRTHDLQSFNTYLTEDDNIQSVNEYNDDIPDRVEGTYKYDFNIMDIHDLIMKRFENQKKYETKKLRRQITEEENKMKNKQNMVERKSSLRRIEKLQNILNDILSDKDFNNYISKIGPLLEQYNIIGTLSKIVSFATNKKKSESESDEEELPEDPEVQDKRHQVIFDFIEIARKYIQIDLVRDIKEGNLCTFCGHKLNEFDDDNDENGVIICSNCNLEKIAIVRSRFYKDSTRTNNSGNNYEDRANFEKVLMRYQGKQPDKPPTELYETLENYFMEKELPQIDMKYITSAEIRLLPLNDEGEKEGTTRTLMYKALKETGNSNYYDHINLILHEVWGWALPDIAHLEDQIMDDYDKSQRVYETLPKDRKSSLNSQFRLFKHLRRLSYPCKSKNFRIPTTHDILEFHENIWSKICEVLNWENL